MMVRNLASAIGAVVLLFVISWKLTLVMLACVPLIAIVAVVYGRYVRNIRKGQPKSRSIRHIHFRVPGQAC